ncbi:MAG: hypothetical protein ACREHG_11045, partial [Candidatus Saccharimonadales bacterium]
MKLTDFPKPAFFRDLEAVIERIGPITVLVLADGAFGALPEALAKWRLLFKGCQILIGCPEAISIEFEKELASSGPNLLVLNMPTWQGTSWSEAALNMAKSIAPVPRCVVSCVSYDPYGTVVKHDLESGVLRLLEHYKALYLVHDTVFGTLRVLDAKLLRDRLYFRPKKIWMYHFVVRT